MKNFIVHNTRGSRSHDFSIVVEGGSLMWQIFVAGAYLVMLLVLLST